MAEHEVNYTTQRPGIFRALRKCAIFLVLGTIMGCMLVAGLCTRRKRRLYE